MLFTVPSRYWCTIGRWRYLALGRGRPRFPPDVTCPAVLTIWAHSPAAAVAYGTLTPAVTRSSGLRLTAAGRCEAAAAPSSPLVQPPLASPAGCAASGVWAPPRSLAATEGILSLPRGTEMFQFPRCPPGMCQVPGRAPGGLPHSDIPGSQAASASPGHFAAWPRPSSAANAKASTMRPSCGFLVPFPSCMRRCVGIRPARARGTSPPSAVPRRDHDRSSPGETRSDPPPNIPTTGGELGRCAGSSGVAVMCFCDVSMQCARAVRHKRLGSTQRSSLPRPQNPTGSAWRIVKVPMRLAMRLPSPLRGRPRRGRHTSSELPKTCVSRTSDEIAPS